MRRIAAVGLRRRLCTSSVDAASVDALLSSTATIDSLARDDDRRAARGQVSFEVPDAMGDGARLAPFEGWGDFFAKRGFPQPESITGDRLLLEQLTAAYTCPLTIAAAQRLTSANTVEDGDVQIDAATGEVMTIGDGPTTASGKALEEVYVLGAASLETLLVPHYWSEISTTIEPSVTVVLIGPDVEVKASTPPIQELGPRLSCMSIGDPFEKFVGQVLAAGVDSSQVTPTFAIAFNAGFALDAASWDPAVRLLLDSGAPIFATAVTEAQARADAEWLESRGAVSLMAPTPNPFASKLPELVDDPLDEESGSDEALAYCNGWWHCAVGASGAEQFRAMDFEALR
jgi:hypothetical protein